MTVSLNEEVRAKLDAHLDAVERALVAAGNSRERRRGVVDDLEAQIMDMLAARSEAPTAGDLEAVLATLDPPGAYGQGGGGELGRTVGPVVTPLAASAARPRYSRGAVAGFVCILLSLVLALVVVVPVTFFAYRAAGRREAQMQQVTERAEELKREQAREEQSRRAQLGAVATQQDEANVEAAASATAPAPGPVNFPPVPVASRANWSALACVLVLIGPLGLAGTVLGWIAFFQIRSSAGLLRGAGLALFDGLFYPVLMVLLLGWRIF